VRGIMAWTSTTIRSPANIGVVAFAGATTFIATNTNPDTASRVLGEHPIRRSSQSEVQNG
jgi:hypothetical protein